MRASRGFETPSDSYERLSKRAQGLKQLLIAVGTPASSPVLTSLTQEARGGAIVGIVAELESLTRECIRHVHEHVNGQRVPLNSITACLRPLAAHDHFESLRTLQDPSKLWERRRLATSLDQQGHGAILPIPTKGPQPPMDGSTPTPPLFSRVWTMYGLPGEPFPNASWPPSLSKLASLRNDIAHGNMPFYEVFQQPGATAEDVERYINDVEQFAAHFTSRIEEYLAAQRYQHSAIQPAL